MHFATAAYNFSASELRKVVRGLQFFNILTLKFAFRHSGVQFCDILTSKNASDLTFFVHFHFKMCFSPQRRTIFQHLNFQKWSRIVSVLTFFTSECAFRHSGVQFFDMSTSKSGPRLWCFAHFDLRMCFSPQRRAIFDVTSQHLPPHPPL